MPATLHKSSTAIGNNRLADALAEIAPVCAKASIDRNPTQEAIEIFFGALADTGLTQDQAAQDMRVDPPLLSRVKNGTARLPFEAMWLLRPAFWVHLRNRIDEAKELSPARVRELRAQRIGELVRLLIEDAA
jgi:hypothetical protein